MSPFGFKSSGERYAAAGQPFGLAPARESMLFGRDKTDLREHSEGMDTSREIPYVLSGVLDGVPSEVFELKIRTRRESSSHGTSRWREERWLVAQRPGDLRFELSGSCALVARRDWGPDEVGTLLQTMRAFRAHLFGTSAPTVAPAPQPSASPARFCGSCGAAAVAGDRFCGACGAPAAQA